MTCHQNVLPEAAAEMLRERFLAAQWRDGTQEVPNHYAGGMRFDSEELPAEDEIFSSAYGRNNKLEADREISALIWHYIVPMVSHETKKEFRRCMVRAYRLKEGQYFRAHRDHEAGEVSFVYYLSKNWRWDWGGLLVVIDGNSKVYLPKFNSMVVMDKTIPHVVTQVAPWAKEPRYMLAGFLK